MAVEASLSPSGPPQHGKGVHYGKNAWNKCFDSLVRLSFRTDGPWAAGLARQTDGTGVWSVCTRGRNNYPADSRTVAFHMAFIHV